MSDNEYDDLDAVLDDEDEGPDGMNCSGVYAPGTEECDWCRWSDFCASLYIKRYAPKEMRRK